MRMICFSKSLSRSASQSLQLIRHFSAEAAVEKHPSHLDSVTVQRPSVITRPDDDPMAAFKSVSLFYGLGSYEASSSSNATWESGEFDVDSTPIAAHRAAGGGFKISDDDLVALVEEVINTEASSASGRAFHMHLGHCLGAAIESDSDAAVTRVLSFLESRAPLHPTLAALLLVRILTSEAPLDHKALLEASATCAGDREDELTVVDAYRMRLAVLSSPLSTDFLRDSVDSSTMSLSFINFINHIVRGSAQASREAAMRVHEEGGASRDIYDISELITKPQLYPPEANEDIQWGFYTGTPTGSEFTDVGSLFFPAAHLASKTLYEPSDRFHYLNDKVTPRWIQQLRHAVAWQNGYKVKMTPLSEWVMKGGDSITQQGFTGVDAWAGLLADRYQRRADIINRGYSGYNTPMTLEVSRHIFKKDSPHLAGGELLLVVIFLGANDAQLEGIPNSSGSPSKHVPLDEYRRSLDDLVKLAKPYASRIILVTPPPVDADAIVADGKARFGAVAPDQPNRKLEVTQEYAKAAKEVGIKNEVPVLDTFTAMQQEVNWQSFLRDGLHFSPTGNWWFYESLVNTIKDNYPDIVVEAGPDGVSYGNSSSRSLLKAEMPWHEQFPDTL
ncbi:isoamyl acetate-hydrolyzing esterase [Perkinsus chesapeaki]|uniref:Isoamyl acetate-hydrolyzing esterase n=1 Tax=Perkinsus chesapeaki TaxID=330153 RepID=A0A7J6MNX8_PERCH|nr:isoamyl acetate-hydrolyzing esterase [Perkinsus chesapeaki]